MTRAEIIDTQQRVGAAPDGFWGPKSIAACQAHLRRLMPSKHPFPAPDQASLTRFYGAAGNVRMVPVPTPYKMYLYNGPDTVSRISVHERLAPSLERILRALAKIYPTDTARSSAGVNRFFGVYNNRPMRGGTTPSLHARAAAIDLDAHRNGLNTHWPTKAKMPIEVMECFAREGWLSAGAFWSRDAMHFQATR